MLLRPQLVWFHMFDSGHLVIGWGDSVEHLQPLQGSLASLGFVRQHTCQEKVLFHATKLTGHPQS